MQNTNDDAYFASLTYEDIATRARLDVDFRDGLIVAAMVANAQGQSGDFPTCPPDMVARYLNRLADGKLP